MRLWLRIFSHCFGRASARYSANHVLSQCIGRHSKSVLSTSAASERPSWLSAALPFYRVLSRFHVYLVDFASPHIGWSIAGFYFQLYWHHFCVTYIIFSVFFHVSAIEFIIRRFLISIGLRPCLPRVTDSIASSEVIVFSWNWTGRKCCMWSYHYLRLL